MRPSLLQPNLNVASNGIKGSPPLSKITHVVQNNMNTCEKVAHISPLKYRHATLHKSLPSGDLSVSRYEHN